MSTESARTDDPNAPQDAMPNAIQDAMQSARASEHDPYPPDHAASGIDPQTDPHAFIAAHGQDRLLHALALLDFDPAAMANELGVSPFALLQWYDSDDTQSQLHRYHAFEQHMLRLRALKSHRRSIESLEHVLETTDNLVEKRRTATTLLRLLSNPGAKPRNSRRTESSAGSASTDAEHHDPQDRSTDTPSPEPQASGSYAPGPPPRSSVSNHAAKPRFVGSAKAEPPSASEPESQPTARQRTDVTGENTPASASEQEQRRARSPDEQPGLGKINRDFFPEPLTSADQTPPAPYQRE